MLSLLSVGEAVLVKRDGIGGSAEEERLRLVLAVSGLAAQGECVGDALVPESVGGAVVEQAVAAIELANGACVSNGGGKSLADKRDSGKGDGGDLDHFGGRLVLRRRCR